MSQRNSQIENSTDVTNSAESTPSVMQLSGTFHFWNEDDYVGEFAVYKEKQKIVRQGKGVYTTGDGETYEGTWENDLLHSNCKISFIDKSVFTGDLNEMVIQGRGKYEFGQKLYIEGDFLNNKLVDGALLKDPNGNMWKGTVMKDGSSVTFRVLHPFWQSVLNMPSGDINFYYDEGAEEDESIWDSYY